MTLSRDFATISVSMKDIKRGYPERTIMVKIRRNKSVHPPHIHCWYKWDKRKWHVLVTYVNGPNGTDENGASSWRTMLVQIGRTRMAPPQDLLVPYLDGRSGLERPWDILRTSHVHWDVSLAYLGHR